MESILIGKSGTKSACNARSFWTTSTELSSLAKVSRLFSCTCKSDLMLILCFAFVGFALSQTNPEKLDRNSGCSPRPSTPSNITIVRDLRLLFSCYDCALFFLLVSISKLFVHRCNDCCFPTGAVVLGLARVVIFEWRASFIVLINVTRSCRRCVRAQACFGKDRVSAISNLVYDGIVSTCLRTTSTRVRIQSG